MAYKRIKKELHRLLIKHQPTRIELVSDYTFDMPWTYDGIRYYVPKLPYYEGLLQFNEDIPIEHVDVSGLQWAGVDNISNMFRDLKHLRTVNFGNEIKQTGTIFMNNTFSGCISLNEVDLSSFDCHYVYPKNMLPHSAPERVVLPNSEYIVHDEFLSPNIKECVFSPKTKIDQHLVHWFYDPPGGGIKDYLQTSFHMTEEQYDNTPRNYYCTLNDNVSIVIH